MKKYTLKSLYEQLLEPAVTTVNPEEKRGINFIEFLSGIIHNDFSSLVEQLLIKRERANSLNSFDIQDFDIPKLSTRKKAMIFFNADKTKALVISTIKDSKLRAVDNTRITLHNDLYGVFIGVIDGGDGYVEMELPNNKSVVFNMNGISVVNKSKELQTTNN